MRKFFTTLLAFFLFSMTGNAEIVTTQHGAAITLDSVTTEIIIYSPRAVRVIKYVGERPALKPVKVKGIPSKPEAGEHRTDTGHNKVKVDTGDYYAALNEKDGNVSFWSHGDTLIMAEQHRTGVLTPCSDGRYLVSQDFQMGRANVENIYCPALKPSGRVNLKDRRTVMPDKKGGLPERIIATDKGFGIYWLSEGEGFVDATPREDKKKQGDITVSSGPAPMIDYLFVK